MRTTTPAVVILLAMALSPAHADQDGWLAQLRNTDLNDYALAVAVTGSQSPYIGISNTTYAYPYLTAFTQSFFTDDWLIIRDGDVGIRWTNSDWEFGVLGRVNTLGLGAKSSDELTGLEERQWTVELGPMVGFRRWPIQLNARVYAEVLGRHSSYRGVLSASYPWQGQRGYIIPSIDLQFSTADYNDYYFGIDDFEATPSRVAYTPGSGTGEKFRLRYGYRLTETLLLQGSVSYESLSNEVTDSPIVDEDGLWSATIGLAYNADLFQLRRYDGIQEPRFGFRVGAFFDSVTSEFRRDSSDGTPGVPFDLEDELGADDDSVVRQFDIYARLGNYHRLELAYFELGRDSSTTLDRNLSIGQTQFSNGADVALDSRFRSARLGYVYSLIKDSQKKVGVLAGFHQSRVRIDVESADGGRDGINTTATLPVIGILGSVALGTNYDLSARVEAFRLDFDQYDGVLTYARLELARQLSSRLSAAVGYTLFSQRLESANEDLRGVLRIRHSGPSLSLGMAF